MVVNLVKGAVVTASSMGIGALGAEATKKLIPAGAGKVTKVCCYVGGCAASSYVSVKVGDFIEDEIDGCVNFFKSLKKTEKK